MFADAFVYVMAAATWALVLVLVGVTVAHVAGGLPRDTGRQLAEVGRKVVAWLNNRRADRGREQ